MNSQQASRELSSTWAPSLSANEVKELVGRPTVHHQRNYQKYYQKPTFGGQHWRNLCYYEHDRECRHKRVDPKEGYVNRFPSNDLTGAGYQSRVNWYDGVQKESHWSHQGNTDPRQEVRFDHNHMKHDICSLYGMRTCHPFIHDNFNINHSNSSRCEDQSSVPAYQHHICYTKARNHNSDDEENCYCPTSGHLGSYNYPDSSERRPSPIYADDSPYTILNTMDSSEPITAIFLGFQKVQDDSGLGQDFDETLKPELVFIDNEVENGENNSTEEKKTEPRDTEEVGQKQTETSIESENKNIQGNFNFLTMCFSCKKH